MKKRKRTLVTQSFSNMRYLLISLILLILLMLLYTSSMEEKTLVVKSKEDIPLAKQTLQQQVQKLEQRVGELRALIT